MQKILQTDRTELKYKEILEYQTPGIVYYAVISKDNEGYIFRTFDATETTLDYRDRLYLGVNPDNTTIPLVLVEVSGDIDLIQEHASKYSNVIKNMYENPNLDYSNKLSVIKNLVKQNFQYKRKFLLR